ncbi:conserved hypothetical protein [Theileria equi strain WA]|uniref:EGF-like domain-containing protein n=1 Tax=Theileria equi strain WA TaxID=1537102 RepID=L1LFH4_THEEQ|nr:conserved hypothetical protein [Theileria equi strain WA]EKX74106.1 conserved hypothetical protein [Theileria equi strain WA]|eukprot:XP_004833558.1 conserved hypothetical protein [Theileria equi strain WA]
MASVFFYVLLLGFNFVNGFFYRGIPVLLKPVSKGSTTDFYVSCPWSDPPSDSFCVITANHIGYQCNPKVTSLDMPLINPNSQKCDVRGSVCADSSKNAALMKCVDHTNCTTVSKDYRLCSCNTGFFGDPHRNCYQHCERDSDCSSPFAECTTPGEKDLPRCTCKRGYSGDGVFCYDNPCGQGNRLAKCKYPQVCIPTGPTEYKCACPSGHFIDVDGKCVPNIAIKKDTILSFHGTNIPDGSRIEAGDCLSFHLNEDGTSKFFHLNSGDPVYVKAAIKNASEFYIAFVIRDEITAYARLTADDTKMTKLYALTNTSQGCSFGSVKVMDKEGNELRVNGATDHQQNLVRVKVRPLTKEELATKVNDEL